MTLNRNPDLHQVFTSLEDMLLPSIACYLKEGTKTEKEAILVSLRNELREFRLVLETLSLASTQSLSNICLDLFKRCYVNDTLRLLLASFFLEVSKNAYFWTQTLDLAQRADVDVASSYNLLLNAEYLGFMNKDAFSDAQYLQEVRRPLKEWYQNIYDHREDILPSLPSLKQGHRRAALLLRLWREPPLYAPALEALDYAYCLSKMFDFKVHFFNANLLHDNMPLPFWPPSQFQPLPEMEEEQIKYKDAVFTLTHRLGPIFAPDGTQKFWTKLQSFKPEFAIAVGDCNLFADILANDIPTVTAHYTSDIPIQIQTITGIQRDLIDREPYSSVMLNPDCKRIFLRPAAVDEPVVKNYTRGQFAIPEDSFVFVVVGNRLRSEVTSEFLTNLEKIRKAYTNAWFVFVGFYDQGEQQLALMPELRAQTTLITHVEDVRGFMLIADVMLNPERAGGGSVAAAALASGKPVLTLSRGDAAYVVGLARAFMNMDDYVAHAIKLATNRYVYDEWTTYCQNRYHDLIDRKFNLLAMQEVATNASKEIE